MPKFDDSWFRRQTLRTMWPCGRSPNASRPTSLSLRGRSSGLSSGFWFLRKKRMPGIAAITLRSTIVLECLRMPTTNLCNRCGSCATVLCANSWLRDLVWRHASSRYACSFCSISLPSTTCIAERRTSRVGMAPVLRARHAALASAQACSRRCDL